MVYVILKLKRTDTKATKNRLVNVLTDSPIQNIIEMWSVVSVWNMRTHRKKKNSSKKNLITKCDNFPHSIGHSALFSRLIHREHKQLNNAGNLGKFLKAWVGFVSKKRTALSHSNNRYIGQFDFELCSPGRCWNCSSRIEILENSILLAY